MTRCDMCKLQAVKLSEQLGVVVCGGRLGRFEHEPRGKKSLNQIASEYIFCVGEWKEKEGRSKKGGEDWCDAS